jgi:hypothetical protein
MALALIIIVSAGAVGTAWAVSYAESNWRSTSGWISAIQDKTSYVTEQCVCTGKTNIYYPVTHYVTDLYVLYTWNTIQHNDTQRVDGWDWKIGQNVTLTVDKTSGNIIFCC